jgi:thiamine biosynthesis lipoprotein
MKKIALLIAVICSLSAQSQIIHKRKLFMLGSPLRLLLLKDTIEANLYRFGYSRVKRIENLISD